MPAVPAPAAAPENESSAPVVRVAVIGAGPAGLITLRRLLEHGRRRAEGARRGRGGERGGRGEGGPRLQVTAYDRNSEIGGTWIYSSVVKGGPPVAFPSTAPRVADPPASAAAAPPPPSSSMYKNLRTNLPTSIMAVPDFPFPGDDDDGPGCRGPPPGRSSRSFPGHETVLDYLRRFSRHFGLEEHVRFNTAVTNVVKRPPGRRGASDAAAGRGRPRWFLTLRDLDAGRVWEEPADAVVVCNGHYSAPYVPSARGLSEYAERQRNVQHSKTYRAPDGFAGKRVLVVGGASSAIDIARDLAPLAKEVVQSVRSPAGSADIGEPVGTTRDPRHSVVVKPEIAEMDPETGNVAFEDGTVTLRPDAVIFATGYLYSFPFLDHLQRGGAGTSTAGVEDTRFPPDAHEVLITDGWCVHNLWEQIFYMKDPSLSFVGLPVMVVPFELFDYQGQVIARHLAGKLKLPSEAEMRAAERERDAALGFSRPEDDGSGLPSGVGSRARHALGMQQYDYCNRLAAFAGLRPVEPWRIEERAITRELRKKSLGY